MPLPSILCINPWIYDFAAYDHWSKPLGLLYIAAWLRQCGLHVDFIDCLDKWHPELLHRQGQTAPKLRNYGIGPFHREIVPKPAAVTFVPRHFARYGLPEDIFLAELQHRPRPDVIFVTSIMTYWYRGPQRVVELCRQVFPKVPIILGGIYATLMPEHAQLTVQPDYLVTGPGEHKVTHLLAELLRMPAVVDGLPTQLDAFPYPAFDLLRHNDYLVVMTSRGCPFRCTFCATYTVDSAFSQRQPPGVVAEILTQTRRLGVHDVAFYDDALLMQADRRIKPILRELLASRQPLRFHTPNGLHARYIDEELAELMYQSGFCTVRLSLESVAKERRRDIHNKITPGEMTRAVHHLVRAGFTPRQLETYIIMGLPQQPLDEVIDTILYANSLGVRIRLSSFSPIPGTLDYERALTSGALPATADPLLTNNTIVPLVRTTAGYAQFHTVSQFVRTLNEEVQHGRRCSSSSGFRHSLRVALEQQHLAAR
ncbi:MAG: radical SAM protein [Candidatus Binatia bacterium]